ncbi:MAG: plasmid stabilization protein ParE [Armatimonadetes bacterium CG_4_9_14_3_um_filter_58_7]|nr:MAG: plasmid stabilization protein ParE [Armatimonadetes bacterium CG_4_9_14_3_um_filter_58_7]
MKFSIEYAEGVARDLRAISTHYRQQILDTIDKQLIHLPLEETRNKKILAGLEPPWEYLPPVRELRVGDYRVFYDVEEVEGIV